MSAGVKVVVTSDNHLNRYYDRMSPQKLFERRRLLRQGFHQAVERALEEDADLFLQGGDLFDTPDPRNLDREFVAYELARLRTAGVQAIGIGGNHDTPKQRTEQGGALPQGTYVQLGGLQLFEGEEVCSTTVECGGLRVAIGALPWSALRHAGTDPLEAIEWAPEADTSIFMFHHSIEGHVYPGPNETIVARASLDRLRNTHLVIAGHVHHHAVWQIGRMVVLIPGATELLTFGETGQPGFEVVVLEAGGVRSMEHVKVPVQPRSELTVRTTELELDRDDGLCASLMRRVEQTCSPDTLVRLHLEGPITRERYRVLDLPRLHDFGVGRSFYFDVDTSGLFVQDEFGNRAAGGVRISQREELAVCADRLLEQAADAAEREILEQTKRALLAYYEGQESG